MQIKTYTLLTLLVFSSAALAWQPLTYPIRSQSPYQRSIDTAMCYAAANKQTKVNIAHESQLPPRKPAATRIRLHRRAVAPALAAQHLSSAPMAGMPAAAAPGASAPAATTAATARPRALRRPRRRARLRRAPRLRPPRRHRREREQQRLGNGGCEWSADGCGIQREAAASAGARAANDTVLGRVWRVHASAGLRRRTVTLLASLVTVPCFFLIVAPAFDAPLRHGDA